MSRRQKKRLIRIIAAAVLLWEAYRAEEGN